MTTRPPTSFNLGRASFTAGAFFCVLLASAVAVRAGRHEAPGLASFAGQATVIDGDTIDVGGQRIRLEGIDAPEVAQVCQRADGRDWPCGRVAIKALRALIGGNDVVCDSQGTDKYGRVLAICFADGRDLNASMVQAGLAWAFVRYSQTYAGEEAKARQALVGICGHGASPLGLSPAWLDDGRGRCSQRLCDQRQRLVEGPYLSYALEPLVRPRHR